MSSARWQTLDAVRVSSIAPACAGAQAILMVCGTFSSIARSTCHGRIPNPLPVHIKDEVGICGRDLPFIARQLAFELTSTPSCVAEGDQYLLRAGLVRDVVKHLPAWGNGGKLFYSDGVEAVVV